jgi:hypothetical protein
MITYRQEYLAVDLDVDVGQSVDLAAVDDALGAHHQSADGLVDGGNIVYSSPSDLFSFFLSLLSPSRQRTHPWDQR